MVLQSRSNFMHEEGPVEISRDSIRRRILVQCNVRGRNLAGFVAEAQEVMDRNVKLPAGRHAADLEFPHALSP